MNTSFSTFLSRGCAAAAGLLVVASLLSAPSWGRSPVDEVQRGFELIDDYVVVMKSGEDLKDVPAQIYSSSATRAILIVPSDIATPSVILWPRSREVEALKSMKVQKLTGGFVEVKKDAVAAGQPPFEVVGTNVVFSVDGTEMRLKPKPPLLGFFDTDAMLEKSSVYAGRAKNYTPSEELLEKLSGLNGTLRVRVYFGTWCPACGQSVPKLLSVADRLAKSSGSSLDFEYYGMPKQGFAEDRQAKAYGIKSVPTGVVFVNDLEVGRIEGNGWRSPEVTLWELLGS